MWECGKLIRNIVVCLPERRKRDNIRYSVNRKIRLYNLMVWPDEEKELPDNKKIILGLSILWLNLFDAGRFTFMKNSRIKQFFFFVRVF